jgi:hypothetical protein
MLSIRSVAATFGALVLAASPAWAVTVTNQAKQEHTLTVDLGEKENDLKIAAGASLKLDCPDGCAVRLRSGPAGYDRMAAGGEALVINQGGFLDYADKELATGSIKEQSGSKSQKDSGTSSK